MRITDFQDAVVGYLLEMLLWSECYDASSVGYVMPTGRPSFCILIPAIAFAIFAAKAFPQQTAPARGLFISGFVRDVETNQLISAAMLGLQRSSGETASPPVVSGTRGEFQFNGVSSGDY